MFDLEFNIRQWCDHLREKGNFTNAQVTELESHLRDLVDELVKKGLSAEEAYIIAVKRIGDSEALAAEYGKINTGTLWKKLAFYDTEPGKQKKFTRDLLLVILLCLAAGTLARIPFMLGLVSVKTEALQQLLLYARNLGLYFMPCIACYFTFKKFHSLVFTIVIFALYAVSAVLINLYPLLEPFHTGTLSAIHLFIFLWLVTGLAYGADRWKESGRRMDFIRFSGEVFIYSVLIACGMFVLFFFTMQIFRQVQIPIEDFYNSYIIQYLVFSIPVVAVYLVEAKKSIVENIAPILAYIFSPLFLVTMLVFLAAVLFFKASPYSDRDFLIIFNLMLILVLGLVLYSVSARKPINRVIPFDWINLALVVTAIIIDCIALSAVIFRISSFGWTVNRLTTLGVNLILLVNLAGLAYCQLRFFIKKDNLNLLEKWQTAYLYIYCGWSALVSFLFPVLFGFR